MCPGLVNSHRIALILLVPSFAWKVIMLSLIVTVAFLASSTGLPSRS
jgi:hypothetical protein